MDRGACGHPSPRPCEAEGADQRQFAAGGSAASGKRDGQLRSIGALPVRVIAGRFKGRQLRAPAWEGLRPTSDKLRETLFNVLAPRIQGARVLDAYAGTGAVGIEALSRGAAWVTFVERDRRAQALIAANLALCGIERGYAIIRESAARAFTTLPAAAAPFDLVLLDPPYDMAADAALNGVDRLVAPDGLVVLEHARKRPSPDQAGRLTRIRELVSGDSALAFYTCQP